MASAQLQQQMLEEAKERDLLAEISQAAVSTLDFDQALDRVFKKLGELVPADRVSINIRTELSGELDYAYSSGVPISSLPGDVRPRPSPNGLPALVAATGKSRLFNRVDETLREAPGAVRIFKAGLNSSIAVPLKSDGRTIGALVVNARQKDAYTMHDLRLVERLSPQLTGAITNSQLHAAVDRYAREEATFAEIGNVFTTTQDFDTAFYRISDLVERLIPFDSFNATGIDEGRRIFTALPSTGPDVDQRPREPFRLPEGTVAEAVLNTGKTQVIHAVEPHNVLDDFPAMQDFVNDGFRSSISVPFVTNGAIRGILNIASRENSPYSDRHIELAERCADQIAGVLAKADLLAQVEQVAREEAVLAEISRIVSSSPNFGEMFDTLEELTGQLVQFDRLAIATMDVNGGRAYMHFVAGVPVEGFALGDSFELSSVLLNSEHLRRDDGVYEIAEIRKEIGEITEGPAFAAGLRCGMGVNLRSHGALIGYLSVRSKSEFAYGQRDLDLMLRIGAQIAGAFANSELRDRLAQRAKEEAVLANVGRVVNSSVDLDDVFEPFAELAGELVHADRIVITTVDGDEHFIERFLSDLPVPGRVPGNRLPLAGSLTGLCVDSQESFRWSESVGGDDLWAEMPVMQPVIDSGVRAVVCVPLAVQGQAFGALSFTSFEARPYSDHEVMLAEAVADQIAGGITGAGLREQASRRAIEESMLSDISGVVNSSLDMSDVFPRFAMKLALLLPIDELVVNVIDYESDEWVDQWSWHGGSQRDERLPRGPMAGSATERAAAMQRPFVLGGDGQDQPSLDEFPGMAHNIKAGLRSSIVAPLLSRSRSIGALFIHSRQPNAYTEEQVDLARRVALIVASAVANARLLEESERTAREHGLLAEIGRLFGSSLEIEELCRLLTEPFGQLIPYDRLAITTYDDQSDQWLHRFVDGVPISGLTRGAYRREVTGMGRRMIDERLPVVVSDHSDDKQALRVPEYVKSGLRSSLLVPLIVMDRVVGVISVHSSRPGAFSERHIYLGEQVGRQITGFLNNAGLYERTLRDAEERTRLADIGRLFSTSLDVDELFGQLVPALKKLVPFDRLSISSYDGPTDRWTTRFTAGIPLPIAEPGDVQYSTTPASQFILDRRSSLLMRDPSDHDGRYHDPRAVVAGLNSLILVPMIKSDSLVGAIGMHASKAGAYSEHHVELLERVASQITDAVVNSELHAQVERHAKDQELLARIGRVVSSSINPEHVIGQLTELVCELIPGDRVMIAVANQISGTVFQHVSVSGPEIPGNRNGDLTPLSGSLTEYVIAGGSVFVWPSPGRDDDPALDIPGLSRLQEAGLSAVVSVPLMALDRTVGVLHVTNFSGGTYSWHDVEMAQAVGAQIAGAIASADLFAKTEREALERAALGEIGRLLNSSLGLARVHAGIAEQVRQLIPYDRFSLAKVNRDDGTIVSLHLVGRQVPGWNTGTDQPLPGTIAEHVMNSGAGLLISVTDPRDLVDRYPGLAPSVGIMAVRSVVAVPLMRQGDVFGVLHLSSEDAGVYSVSDLQLAERIASQITGPIINADLFARTEEHTREREGLAEIGRIVGSTLDLEDLWPRFVKPFRRLVQFDRLSVILHHPDLDEWRTAFVDGVGKENEEPGDKRSMGMRIARKIVRDRNSIIVTDVDSDPENAALLRSNGTGVTFRSMVAVPIIFNDTFVGGISIKSVTGGAYGTRHCELLEHVADLLTGAITNSQLHAAANRRAEDEKVLSSIGRSVSASLDFSSVFENLADSVLQLVPYDRFEISGLTGEDLLHWTRFVAGREAAGWEPGTSHLLSNRGRGLQLLPAEGLRANSDPALSPDDDAMVAAGLLSFIHVPLVWEDRVIGAVSVRAEDSERFSQHHQDLLVRVAHQITGAFVGAELHAITVREVADRSIFAEISRVVNTSLDVQEMFQGIAEPFKQLVPYDRLAITTFDAEADVWTTVFVAGKTIAEFEPGDQREGDSPVTRWLRQEQRPVVVNGDHGPDYASQLDDLNSVDLPSAVHVPLVVSGEIIGVISARSSGVNVYSQKHLDLTLWIGNQIAGAVANAKLHRALVENEARARAVIETAAVGIVTANTQVEILTVNDAVLEMFGYERAELIGQNVSVLAAEPFRTEHSGYVERFHETGVRHIIGTLREVEGRRRDGTTFPIEVEVVQVDLEHRHMYTGVIRDITDRKRAEAEVRELSENLE